MKKSTKITLSKEMKIIPAQTQFPRFIFSLDHVDSDGELIKNYKVVALDLTDAIEVAIDWLDRNDKMQSGSDVISTDEEEVRFTKNAQYDII